MGVSGTDRKVIVVRRGGGQVQGNPGFLWEVFRSGKVRVVAGMIVDDFVEYPYWSSVEVIEYDRVSER